MQLIQDGEVTRAVLDDELTIFTAEALQDELFGLLNHARVELDLSAVTELDGCGAQLLCILLAEAQRMERSFAIRASNPLVDEVGRWLGLTPAQEAAGEEHHGS
ncbi:hypothetical protein BI347_19265 [Chromobacterium sphagni]|uniref:STAS domain-containing protein n=2 Tax=Chromobacterium sphagni TaxID=1903179 RepID=A0A1S1WTS8_9NEIS|nr:hypothetical protein BI347_19265 [Chromobacterium sphagni]